MQISNVGFVDIGEEHLRQAVSKDTLFIHGSASSSGGKANSHKSNLPETHHRFARDCTAACGSASSVDVFAGSSTFCDESCSPSWSVTGPRFGGYNCGAGNSSMYGNSCRLCYTSQSAALVADRELAPLNELPSADAHHVVMCDTGKPSPASNCSAECANHENTVRYLLPPYREVGVDLFLSFTPKRLSSSLF